MRLRARHYATGQLLDLVCGGGLIQAVETPGSNPPDRQAGRLKPVEGRLQHALAIADVRAERKVDGLHQSVGWPVRMRRGMLK